MGNTPSAIEVNRRAPHKLFKPRTSQSTTAGLLSTDGPARDSPLRLSSPGLSAGPPLSYPFSPVSATTNDSAAFLGLEGAHATPEPVSRRSSILSQKARRLSLFRSKSSREPEDFQERPGRRNSSIGPLQRSRTVDPSSSGADPMALEVDVASYYGEAISDHRQPGSRTSWHYNLTSYEAQRLLNLVEEPAHYEQSTTVITESKCTVVSEVTWRDSQPAGAESAPITRANSDLSLYTPVRRRSVIQTPGVATRAQTTSASRRASFRHSHPPTPSLSRHQSIESMGSRVLSMPPLPRLEDLALMPRVVTPSEGDYQAMGAFKLGSLRITNGTASPMGTPEPGQQSQLDEHSLSLRNSLDYFSAEEHLEVAHEGGAIIGRTTDTRISHVVQRAHIALQLSPLETSPAPVDDKKQPLVTSPAPVDDKKQPLVRVASIATPGTDVEVERLPVIQVKDTSPKSPTSPTLQTTSKHTALEDNLFDEDTSQEYLAPEVLDVRLDPNAKSEPEAEGQRVKGIARSDSGIVASPTSEFLDKAPLSKADSGYSSNVSLRSFQLKPRKREIECETQPQTASPEMEDPMTVEEPPLQPLRQAPPPPLPPKDAPRVSRPASAGGTVKERAWELLSTPNMRRKRQALPKLDSTVSDEAPVSPSSVPLTPSSAKSDGSAMRIVPPTQKQGRLQRFLSLSRRRGSLAVHTTHVQEKADIPSVPRDIEDKLHEHSGLFPMTTKRLALKKQLSKDTLKTILSVGSFDLNHGGDGPAKVTSEVDALTEAPLITKTANPRRHTFQGVPASFVQVATNAMPMRKPIQWKPVPNRHGQPKETVPAREAELSTYQAINESLGNNPYDAAFMALTEQRNTNLHITERGRRMSMTAQMERRLSGSRMPGPRTPRSVGSSTGDLLSPSSLPTPLRSEMFPPKNTRTPPPVSMRTQKLPSALRVPPPLRSRSTPPRMVTRKTSRENVYSYPQASLDRQGPASPPSILPMDPRRSMSSRDLRSFGTSHDSVPGWHVQTSQSSSRRSSFDGSRNNSLTSRSQMGNYPPPRPRTGPQQGPRPQGQPLRHRASYEDRRSFPGSGSMLAPPPHNGQMKPVMGPSYGGGKPRPYSQSPVDPQLQWDQGGRYPPYVPRGHPRARAGSLHPMQQMQAPFRVLHSYNSPAYRNAPIWG